MKALQGFFAVLFLTMIAWSAYTVFSREPVEQPPQKTVPKQMQKVLLPNGKEVLAPVEDINITVAKITLDNGQIQHHWIPKFKGRLPITINQDGLYDYGFFHGPYDEEKTEKYPSGKIKKVDYYKNKILLESREYFETGQLKFRMLTKASGARLVLEDYYADGIVKSIRQRFSGKWINLIYTKPKSSVE